MREDLRQKRKEMRPKAKKGGGGGIGVEIVGLTPELEAMASGDYSGSGLGSESPGNFDPDG